VPFRLERERRETLEVKVVPDASVADPVKMLFAARVKEYVPPKVSWPELVKVPEKAPTLAVRDLPFIASVPPVQFKLERERRSTLEVKVVPDSMSADPLKLLPPVSRVKLAPDPEVRVREPELMNFPEKLPPFTVRALAPISSVPLPVPLKFERLRSLVEVKVVFVPLMSADHPLKVLPAARVN